MPVASSWSPGPFRLPSLRRRYFPQLAIDMPIASLPSDHTHGAEEGLPRFIDSALFIACSEPGLKQTPRSRSPHLMYAHQRPKMFI